MAKRTEVDDWEPIGGGDEADDWEPIGGQAQPKAGSYKSKYNWDTNALDPDQPDNGPSKLVSLGHGALDSASLGFDDEAIGALESLFSSKTYKEARDEWRKRKRDAEEANPKSYMGGEIGGAIAGSFLIPGAGALKGASTAAKIGNAAKSGAIIGGISGLGSSESEDLPGMASDAAKSAAGGAVIGGGMTAAGKVLSKGTDLIPAALKEKGYRLIGDIDENMAKVIKERPELVKKAASASDQATIADDLAGALDKLEAKSAKLSENAWSKLQKIDDRFSDMDMRAVGRKALDIAEEEGLGKFKQPAQQEALKKLRAAAGDVMNAQSYSDLKRAIQAMDDNINWKNQDSKVSNRVLMRFRTAVDSHLKDISPEYKSAMAPLAEVTDAMQKIRRNFGVERGPEIMADGKPSNYYASDRTSSKVNTMKQSAFKPKNEKMKEILRKAAPGVADDIDSLAMKEYMDRDIGRGSRSPVVGAALGGLLPWLGPVAGGALGYARDKAGREFAAKGIARIGERAQRIIDNVPDGPFQQLLQKAARRGGGAAVILYHNLLKEKYPEYRDMAGED